MCFHEPASEKQWGRAVLSPKYLAKIWGARERGLEGEGGVAAPLGVARRGGSRTGPPRAPVAPTPVRATQRSHAWKQGCSAVHAHTVSKALVVYTSESMWMSDGVLGLVQ